MDPQQILLPGVLLPAIATGLVLAFGWKLWRRAPAGIDGRWSGAPALALGFAAAFVAISGVPTSFLPGSSRTPTGLDWLAWLTIPLALVLPSLPKFGRWRHLLRGVIAVSVVRLVLHNAFQRTWEDAEGWKWLGGLSALYLLMWTCLEWISSRRSGASSPLLLWTLAAGLAALAALTGSARIGQLGGAVAAGLGAASVIAWRWPRLTMSGSGVSMALALLFGLGLNAHVFSYTSATDILLVASAPFVALLAELPLLRQRKPSVRTASLVLLALVPIAVALTRAGLEFAASGSEYDY